MNMDFNRKMVFLVIFSGLFVASSAFADQCPISPNNLSGWQMQGAPIISQQSFLRAEYTTNVAMYCFYSSSSYPFPGFLYQAGTFTTSGNWVKSRSNNGLICSSPQNPQACQFNLTM